MESPDLTCSARFEGPDVAVKNLEKLDRGKNRRGIRSAAQSELDEKKKRQERYAERKHVSGEKSAKRGGNAKKTGGLVM